MTTLMEQAAPARADADLVEAIRDVLRMSPEPMTLPRIREALPVRHARVNVNALAAALERQVSAQVIFLYPKYRSGNDRYWHRPVQEHVAQLLKRALGSGPRSVAELRRCLPDYAKILAEPILEEELARGRIFAHPPLNPRMGVRFGLMPPVPAPYLEKELEGMYERMSRLGFNPSQVRQALLTLLQGEQEWTAARLIGPHYAVVEEPITEASKHEQILIPETMF